MRYVIYLLLFIYSNIFAQSYSIPVAIVDSMFFEIQQGRACSKVSATQTTEIIKLQTAQLADGELIRLKSSEVSHLEEIIQALQKEANADKVLSKEKSHALKVRIRKLLAIVIGEAGVIVVLVLLL